MAHLERDLAPRNEYDHLARLCSSALPIFGVTDPAAAENVAHFLQATECIDAVMDTLRGGLRRQVAQEITRLFSEGGGNAAGVREAMGVVPRAGEMVAQTEWVRDKVSDREAFFQLLTEFWQANSTMHETTDPDEFIAARLYEGDIYGEMITQVLGSGFHELSASMREKLILHFQLAVRIFNMVDTCKDAGKDFKNGELCFPPTLRFRARLLGQAVRDSAALVHNYPDKKILMTRLPQVIATIRAA